MPLLLIGYWKATLGDPYPFAQEVVGELAPSLRRGVADYLDGGIEFNRYRGDSWCRFGCPEANGSAELTDGTWVWPEGLSHYVRHHQVLLPPEFLTHASAFGPPPRALHFDRDREFDESHWLEWASHYRKAALTTALAEAVDAAKKQCDAVLAKSADDFARKHGLGDSGCMTAGCRNTVARDMAFCPRCLQESSRELVAEHAEGDALGEIMRDMRWKSDV